MSDYSWNFAYLYYEPYRPWHTRMVRFCVEWTSEACMFCFPNESHENQAGELFHSNFVLSTYICTHNLWEDKGTNFPKTFPSLGNKTSKLLQLFHGRKFEPTSLPPSGIASFATSSHYEQRLTHQKRKTEWLLRATVSRGVAGMVAVMVCFSDFFIAIAIGGESLCFLRMWVRQEWTIFLNVILKSWLRQP